MRKLRSSCYWAPSLSPETRSLLCIRAPLIKSQSKGQTLLGNGDIAWLQLYSHAQRSDSSSWWSSYYIKWNKSLQLASRPYISMTLLIRSFNSMLSACEKRVHKTALGNEKKTCLNLFFLHVSHSSFLENPRPFHSISSCLSASFHIPTQRVLTSLSRTRTQAHTRRRPHWENKETSCQQTAVYFTTQHRAKALGNKKKTKAEDFPLVILCLRPARL